MAVDRTERTVHHLIADNNGIILECSETDLYKTFSGQAEAGTTLTLIDRTLPAEDFFTGYELEILSGINSGNKIKVSTYNTAERKITLKDPMPHPIEPGTFYRVIKRVKSYRRINNGITYSYTGWQESAKLNEYLKLADVYVTQNLAPKDIESLDIRLEGGGIKEKEVQTALGLQDEVDWYWDLGKWDGNPYPGMGAIILKLPKSILQEAGGSFTREQVQDIVYKHAADGSYIIIKYYDESTEITKIIPGDKQAYVEWHATEPTGYNVYYGKDPSNLSLYCVQPGHRNSVNLVGLENEIVYYIQIEPVIGEKAQNKSRILGFMPFNFANQ